MCLNEFLIGIEAEFLKRNPGATITSRTVDGKSIPVDRPIPRTGGKLGEFFGGTAARSAIAGGLFDEGVPPSGVTPPEVTSIKRNGVELPRNLKKKPSTTVARERQAEKEAAGGGPRDRGRGRSGRGSSLVGSASNKTLLGG